MPSDLALILVPLGALAMVALGLAIAFLPPRKILAFDRLAGRRMYEDAPDEETGLRRAGLFYRAFGCLFALVALVIGSLISLFLFLGV